MTPSHVAAKLRAIASKIDQSKNPDRKLVARDIKHILSALAGSKVQRIITDEPQGIAVGFHLSDDELGQLGATVDEWDLVSDDGGLDSIPVLIDNDKISIRPYPSQEEISNGIRPLGPDMHVWRSKQEVFDDLNY